MFCSHISVRFDEFPKDCATGWFEIVFQPQHRLRNRARVGSGKAHDADSTAPWWRGQSNDCVIKIHARIVAGNRAATNDWTSNGTLDSAIP